MILTACDCVPTYTCKTGHPCLNCSSVLGHVCHIPQDTGFPEVATDVCALAMTTLAGPERLECLQAAQTPWANESELRGWMAMVDWVLMLLRNTHSWAGASGKRALSHAVDGILRCVLVVGMCDHAA